MFSKQYEFKYSDLDNKGNVKVSTVVDLLQDISIGHSAAVGYDLERMREISLAMLLHGWRIKLIAPLRHNVPATFSTGIMNIKRCDVMRCYEIVQEGEVVGIATADWFSFDTENKTVIRVPEQINSDYDRIDEEDNEFPIVKLRPSEDAVEVAGLTVTRRDLDTNNHVNNVKSVEIALDYIPADREYTELQVVYNRQLLKDETVSVFVKDDGTSYAVELRNGQGETCVIVRTV